MAFAQYYTKQAQKSYIRYKQTSKLGIQGLE